jgi:hypothetical protein
MYRSNHLATNVLPAIDQRVKPDQAYERVVADKQRSIRLQVRPVEVPGLVSREMRPSRISRKPLTAV